MGLLAKGRPEREGWLCGPHSSQRRVHGSLCSRFPGASGSPPVATSCPAHLRRRTPANLFSRTSLEPPAYRFFPSLASTDAHLLQQRSRKISPADHRNSFGPSPADPAHIWLLYGILSGSIAN